MSETRDKDALTRALAAWPAAEKPQSDWDDMAAAVVDRIEAGDPGTTKSYLADEKIFAAPVGQLPEEGHNSAHASPVSTRDAKKPTPENGPMSFAADREGERKSLQDLARLASLTPAPPSTAPKSPAARAGEAKGDDSGLINLAALAAPSTDTVAGPATPAPGLASAGLFDEDPASMAPPSVAPPSVRSAPAPSARISAAPISAVPSAPVSAAPISAAPISAASAASAASMAPISAVPSAPVSAAPMMAPTKKKSSAGLIIVGALVGVAALAAGGAFVVRGQLAKQQAVAMAPKTEAAPTVATPAPKADDNKVAQADTPSTPSTDSVDPSQLPSPNAAAPKTTLAAKGAPVAAPKAAASAEPKKADEKPEGPQMSAKDLPQTAPGASGGLNDAMRQAAGPSTTTNDNGSDKKGPDYAPGSVPQKPSQGALTGALGAVLPSARACLGPDDPVSRATVVFSSNGAVQSVAVSGGAAGKPAEGCIKGALGKAKLQPFAESTYTTTVTVRH